MGHPLRQVCTCSVPKFRFELTRSAQAPRTKGLGNYVALLPMFCAMGSSPVGCDQVTRGLVFTRSPPWGLCRGMMGPLIRCQYGVRAPTLTLTLRRNFLWRLNAFGSLPARSIPLRLSPHVGAHSDAQGFGHVANRALLPEDITAPLHLPTWIIDVALGLEGGLRFLSSNSQPQLTGSSFDSPKRWKHPSLFDMRR